MNNTDSKIDIVSYSAAHRQRFKDITVQWVTRSYKMEEEDWKAANDPEGYILENGGFIFIAMINDYPVGTCAYLNLGNNIFEMIKMAVDEDYRGLGIGKKIGEESVKKMKENGAKKIILFSNRKGSARAIEMYHKLGFHEVPLGESEFARADIRMEMELN